MQEIWKDVKGYEGIYQVSNLGKVKSLRRNKLMNLRTDYRGYLDVMFSVNKKTNRYKIHRLVAEAFIPNPNNYPQVNHIDENKTNNRVDNLEWCTNEYNYYYGTAKERRYKTIKNKNKSKIKKGRKKEVNQYDLYGKFIRSWNSIKEASEEYKILSSNISYCCNGIRKTAKGYIWKWK